MTLIWNKSDTIHEVKQGEVVIISHNRGTWNYPQDPERINCVVAYLYKDRFLPFGPGSFDIDEIDAWARFNPPELKE